MEAGFLFLDDSGGGSIEGGGGGKGGSKKEAEAALIGKRQKRGSIPSLSLSFAVMQN